MLAGNCWCLPSGLPVQHIQYGDEELVCVLLLVAGEVPGMRPNKEEQLKGVMRGGLPGVKLKWREGGRRWREGDEGRGRM